MGILQNIYDFKHVYWEKANSVFTWKLFSHTPMVGKNLGRSLEAENFQYTHQEKRII